MTVMEMEDEKTSNFIGTTYADKFGVSSMQGSRRYMEDSYISVIGSDSLDKHAYEIHAVYDGHGGSDAAEIAAAKLHGYIHENINLKNYPDESKIHEFIVDGLCKAFLQTDRDITYTHQGTTAAVAFIKHNRLFFANVGASRGVLCADGKAFSTSADHTIDNTNEGERIDPTYQNTKVKKMENGLWYVRCDCNEECERFLRPTRALGGHGFKPLVMPVPEIKYKDLKPTDTFMIIASDGLWDKLDNQEAVDLVKEDLNKENPTPKDFGIAAKLLRDAAYIKGSNDNITVMIIGLKK